MALSYRLYEEEDEYNIVNLLTTVFGRWPSYDINCDAVDHWRWKYLENPVRPGFISLCLDGDNIVGCFHSVPMRIKIGLNIYNSVTGTDLVVHPDYRRMGMYGEMKKRLFESEKKVGIDFRFGVSDNPILIDKVRRSNYSYLPHDAYKFVKISDLAKHVEKWPGVSDTQKYGFMLLKPLNETRNKLQPIKYEALEVKEANSFPDSVDNLWENVKNNYNFIVERRSDYLNWRYCHPHSSDYRILYSGCLDRWDGFAVLRIDKSRPDYHIGYIVDFLTRHGEVDCEHSLLSEAVEYFRRENANMVLWQIIEKSHYSKLANSHGFLNSRSKLFFNYPNDYGKIKDEKIFQNSHANELHFTYGDYDQI